MRSEILSLIFSLVLLLGSATNIKGKSLPNLQKNQTEIGNKGKNNQGNLRKLNNYDTYITIYFKEDVTYSSGFNNDYRSDINYIINIKDKTKQLNKEATLNINKDYGIEIHFGAKVTKLSHFFSKYYDENMQYLISVDFSNFDSSLVTSMSKLFIQYVLKINKIIINYYKNGTKTLFVNFFCCSFNRLNDPEQRKIFTKLTKEIS